MSRTLHFIGPRKQKNRTGWVFAPETAQQAPPFPYLRNANGASIIAESGRAPYLLTYNVFRKSARMTRA